jgi:cytidine deaminase
MDNLLLSLPTYVDARPIIMQSLRRLVETSRQAVEQLAHSYRGFNVGAAMLAESVDGDHAEIFSRGNHTPYAGAPWGCAEKRTIEHIEEMGLSRVLAISVAGPPYSSPEHGIDAPTCQPCMRCIGLLGESSVVTSDTLLVTTSTGEDFYEVSTVGSLLASHEIRLAV